MERIGIPVPTARDQEYNLKCWPEYASAVRAAGGEPVRLELHLPASQRDVTVQSCAGFVLPGSPADVDPARYGQTREEFTATADPLREASDLSLLEHAEATGKPVLAICFGMQLLNAWLGGTLVQHLLPQPVNHAAGPSVQVAHSVLVERESLLAGLLTPSEAPVDGDWRRLMVNSSHHQAVGIPAGMLAVVARSGEDGVIEAVEGRVGQAAMAGVQWHPERSTAHSASARALFTWLLSEAADWRERAMDGSAP